MPSRAPRASGSSAISRKSSTQTLKSRASLQYSPDADAIEETPLTTLRNRVCAVFSDAQRSTTGHRKLLVSLRKVQEACCYEPSASQKQTKESDDFDETDFNDEVERCVMRMLTIKKSEAVGDRLVRFLGLFLKHSTDLDNAIFREQDQDENEDQSLPETPSSRLTAQLLACIIPLLTAKDKIVRYRCTQIIAHLINTLDSVDDELFDHIRLGLLKRLRDKESSVRVQAVYGLGRLAGEGENEPEDDDSDDDTAGGVLEKLLDALQNDPSADVRRSLLLNLPFTPVTLPFLLERARDVDPSLRRALYSRLLPALGDFRHLSLTHREKLLRWGLRDRDENVRKATARLFRERWIEDCARAPDAEPVDLKQLSPPSSEGLLELLERIDVVNSGVDGGIALDAMKDFWEGRPDYRDFLTFDEEYWRQLSPESAFVARTFNDFCREHQDPSVQRLAEDKLPEVTRFAFLLQQNINSLVETVQRIALQEDAEEDSVQQEFVVEQLLYVALTLDYSDEIGRRKMFSLMREALALAELPEDSTRLVVEVLRSVCDTNPVGERDFCGVVLEAVAEVHDTIMGDEPEKKDDEDESFHSAKSEISGDGTPNGKKKTPEEEEMEEEKAIREIMVNMKCLHIAQCMLQNVEFSLEQNGHLVTMLNNLVVPAVRSQEAPIRERGLLCLGLCCLIDKNLAEENLTLFLHCFNKGHETLQNIAIQIIGDILTAHSSLLSVKISAQDQEANVLHKPIQKLFVKALKSPSVSIQSTACTALSKLMLSAPSGDSISILNTDDLLKLLTVAYFDPQTTSNPALRQSLSYFLPVYCHSRQENMERMGRIALSVLHWCCDTKEEIDVEAEDDSEMVGLPVVVSHLVDWTDGRKLILVNGPNSGISASDIEAEEAGSDVHLNIAIEVLEKVLGTCSREEKKWLMSLMSKLHITKSSNPANLLAATELVIEAIDSRVFTEAASRNALTKLQTSLVKASTSQNRSTSTGHSSLPHTLDEDIPVQHDSADTQYDVEQDTDYADTIRESETGQEKAIVTTSFHEARAKAGLEPAPASVYDSKLSSDPDMLDSCVLDEDEDTIMGEAPPETLPLATSTRAFQATTQGETTEVTDSSLLTESEPSTPAPARPSPSKAHGGRKPAIVSKYVYEDDSSMVSEASSRLSISVVSDMPSEISISEIEQPVKARTRTTKGALATLGQAPARRSVRSSRRKTGMIEDGV